MSARWTWLGLLFACFGSSQPAFAEDYSIRFTTEPTPVGLIHWWAEEKGIFAKNGLKYTDTLASAAYIGLQGIGAGTNDVASANEPPVVTYISKGVDAIVVANLAQSKEVYKMVAPTTIARIEELKGKRVTWMGGTGAEYAMIRFLQSKGMTPKDFQFLNLAPAEELATLLNGGADAMWSWEPWPRKALAAQSNEFHVIGTSSIETYEGNMVTTVRREFAREHPEALRLYLRTLIESTKQIGDHEPEAAELYARKLRVSTEEAESTLHDYKIGVWLDGAGIKTLRDVAKWELETGHISAVPEWNNIIDPSFLRAVDPSHVSDLGQYN